MIRQASPQVQALIEPIVVGFGYEFVGIEYSAQGRHSLLRVYIDKESGINVDDCALVSRQISNVLDVEDPISGQYALEVSSPGLERPLFSAAHFEQFVGRKVRLHLSVPVAGRRKFSGVLKGLVDGVVEIESNEELLQVRLDDIEKANLVPDFD